LVDIEKEENKGEVMKRKRRLSGGAREEVKQPLRGIIIDKLISIRLFLHLLIVVVSSQPQHRRT